jgi:protein-S-isoprenylcysteine O-methyltransferase Ste14
LEESNGSMTRKSFWVIAMFYIFIGLEFLYMASPFAIYFYSVYKPGLTLINSSPTLAWLCTIFMPHIVGNTSSILINSHNYAGAVLAFIGFFTFMAGAAQVYYYKLTKKGAVTGGIYDFIRHPQYVSLVVCSFGLLLLWPRYIVLISFITMLFAYYFLAKVEEKECEKKFGESYVTYKNKTHMFIPMNIRFLKNLPTLPESKFKKGIAIFIIYIVALTIGLSMAIGLRSLSLNSLYALDRKDAVYISTSKINMNSLEKIVNIDLESNYVKKVIDSDNDDPNIKLLNYVLPSSWQISEIPMNEVKGASGHEMPKNYDPDLWKIIFTQALIQPGKHPEGRNILMYTKKRIPLVEVWVDLKANKVTQIKDVPKTTKFGDIPLPLY